MNLDITRYIDHHATELHNVSASTNADTVNKSFEVFCKWFDSFARANINNAEQVKIASDHLANIFKAKTALKDAALGAYEAGMTKVNGIVNGREALIKQEQAISIETRVKAGELTGQAVMGAAHIISQDIPGLNTKTGGFEVERKQLVSYMEEALKHDSSAGTEYQAKFRSLVTKNAASFSRENLNRVANEIQNTAQTNQAIGIMLEKFSVLNPSLAANIQAAPLDLQMATKDLGALIASTQEKLQKFWQTAEVKQLVEEHKALGLEVNAENGSLSWSRNAKPESVELFNGELAGLLAKHVNSFEAKEQALVKHLATKASEVSENNPGIMGMLKGLNMNSVLSSGLLGAAAWMLSPMLGIAVLALSICLGDHGTKTTTAPPPAPKAAVAA